MLICHGLLCCRIYNVEDQDLFRDYRILKMQTKYESSDIQAVLYKYLFKTLEFINKNYGKRFFYFWDAPSELVGSRKTPCILFNSTYFENIGLSYFRLKNDTSASEALDSILLNNKHILDCTSALILTQYNALKMTLIHFLGKKEGEQRFDFLFGSKSGSPQLCRMLISIHSPLTAHAAHDHSDLTILGINPLLCFIDFTDQVKTNETYPLQTLKVGQFCHIQGHPFYHNRHNEGASAGLNVLVCKNNKFMTFSVRDGAVDYNTLLTYLSDRYNAKPINSEPSIKSSLFKDSSAKDMVGFMKSSVNDFLYSQIKSILTYDAFSFSFFNILKAMNTYLDEAQQRLPINKIKKPNIHSSSSLSPADTINHRLGQLTKCKETKEEETPKRKESLSTGFFSNKPKPKASDLYNQTILLIKDEKFNEARESCESAKVLYSRSKGEYSTEVGNCLSAFATCYRELNMFDESLSACESGIKIFSELNKKNLAMAEMALLIKKYNVCLDKCGFDVPTFYKSAVELYKETNYLAASNKLLFVIQKYSTLSSVEKGNCYSTLASCYREMGEHGKAIRACEDAIESFKIAKINPAKKQELIDSVEDKLKKLSNPNAVNMI